MPKEFHYRLSRRAYGYMPGHHRGARTGSGQEFAGHVSLLAAPDPRRLDVRASLYDPFGAWLVRTYRQRTSVPVYLVADLSASMGVPMVKMDTLADCAASAAYSTHRTGDRFGCVAFDAVVRIDFCLPATRASNAGQELADRLRTLVPEGSGASGLLGVPDYLGSARALIFLASDFHFPLPLLELGLQGLARHDVVPIVLWHEAEFDPLHRFGLVELYDAESGGRRTVVLRPAFRERWKQAFAGRREELVRCFLRHRRQPLFFTDGFNADALTGYFFSAFENPR